MAKNQDVAFDLKRKELNHAKTIEDKIKILEELAALNPRGTEALQSRTRFKKELENLRNKKPSKGKGQSSGLYQGITYDRQLVLVGQTNTGKSTLLEMLSGSHPKISENPYTTYKPEIGIWHMLDVPVQIIEIPALYLGESDDSKFNFIRNSDVICITGRTIDDIAQTVSYLEDYLIIPSSDINPLVPHKYQKKDEIIYKPTFLATWENLDFPELLQVNISDDTAIATATYNFLNIMRVYSFRDGEVDGLPVVFSNQSIVTLRDFADKFDKSGRKGFKKGKLFSENASFRGQTIGMDYELSDGDKIWLTK